MKRYLDTRKLGVPLAAIFQTGTKGDLLSDQTHVFAWDDKESPIQSTRRKGSFHVTGDRINQVDIAFVAAQPEGMNLSGGVLRLRYRSAEPMSSVLIALKPTAVVPADSSIIPMEIFARLAGKSGREREIEIPLPATPGLMRVKEVVITSGPEMKGQSIDFRVTGLECASQGASSVP